MTLVAGLTAAATSPPKIKVHFAACTAPGVEQGCVVARSGGRLYDVTGVKPHAGAYEWLQGVGEVTNKVSICQQGQVINRFVPDADQPQVRCRTGGK